MTADERAQAFINRWRSQVPKGDAYLLFPKEVRRLVREAVEAENEACQKVAEKQEKLSREAGSTLRAAIGEKIKFDIQKRVEK